MPKDSVCRWEKQVAIVLFGVMLATMGWDTLLALSVPASEAAKHQRPNVVLILVDDLGRQDMGCEGATFYETPNIDRLAKHGMRFENAYAACQVCSPSRAAIQTGRAPARLHITDYIGAPQPEQWKRNTKLLPAAYQPQLPLEERTIAEALVENGYRTFFAGKWHLGGDGFLPTDQGYQINVGGHAAGTPPGGFFSPYKNPQLADGPVGESLPLRLGQETAQFIRQNAATPFFAMLSFYSVHAPLQTTKELWQKYRDKAEGLGLATPRTRFLLDRTMEVRQVQDHPIYAGMIESMDRAVGIVLDAIQEAGQAENTIVLFTSDNGGVSSGDGFATSCLPLRGGKGRQWEGGLRVPLYIHWPGVTHGTTSPSLAIGTDFFPTILEMAGVASPSHASSEKGSSPPLASSTAMDGRSLVPILRGGIDGERALYWHYPHYGNQGGEPSAAMRRGDWKLIHYFEEDRIELYNLQEDIGEQHDLALVEPARAAAMRAELASWQTSVGAAMPCPHLGYDSEQEAKRLSQLKSVGMAKREAEHQSYFRHDYAPPQGWPKP